jgi:hypothetical protein
VHWPRPPGPGYPHRPGDVRAQRRGARGRPCGLDGGRGHVRLSQLLEAVEPHLIQRGMPGQHDQGRLGGKRRHESTYAVGMPGPPREEGNAGLVRETAPRVGHVCRGALVTYVDDAQARVDGRIEDGHDVITREGEDAASIAARQAPGQNVGSTQCHAGSPARPSGVNRHDGGPSGTRAAGYQPQSSVRHRTSTLEFRHVALRQRRGPRFVPTNPGPRSS